MSRRFHNNVTRDAFERRCARLESFGQRLEAKRAIRFAKLCERSRELIQWGVDQGLLQYPQNNNHTTKGNR